MERDGNPVGMALDEALEALRSDLASAQAKAAHECQLPVNTLTVELKVGVTRSKDGKAGFHVPLIEAELGGSAGVGRQTLQTVMLEWVAGGPGGQPDRRGFCEREAERVAVRAP